MALCVNAGTNLLLLNDEELRVLHDIMYFNITGDSATSRRSIIDGISIAITDQHPDLSDHTLRPTDINGKLNFEDIR